MKHSVGITLPAGTATTVFTVPKGYVAEVDMLFISNHSGNNKTVTAVWKHAHNPAHQIRIIDGYSLAAKQFIQFSDGSIIMHDVLINAQVEIGSNCIINTKALIEHDSKVGNHCHISTGAIVNGRVTIGHGTFIGSNAVVRESIQVKENFFVRSGSLFSGVGYE
jgi:UDP-3-O-[3-hydroxymyristoyl] glucosamine N-acyltransferase